MVMEIFDESSGLVPEFQSDGVWLLLMHDGVIDDNNLSQNLLESSVEEEEEDDNSICNDNEVGNLPVYSSQRQNWYWWRSNLWTLPPDFGHNALVFYSLLYSSGLQDVQQDVE